MRAPHAEIKRLLCCLQAVPYGLWVQLAALEPLIDVFQMSDGTFLPLKKALYARQLNANWSHLSSAHARRGSRAGRCRRGCGGNPACPQGKLQYHSRLAAGCFHCGVSMVLHVLYLLVHVLLQWSDRNNDLGDATRNLKHTAEAK